MEKIEKLLEQLYSYEYFGVYLTISIVVLIILFFVILFFGKKDQKEREKTATLKLQQINNEAFKEELTEAKLEITDENKLENDTIIVPNINTFTEEVEEIPEPELPIMETNNLENINVVTENYNEPTLVMEPFVENSMIIENDSVMEDIVEPTFPSVPEQTLIMEAPILPEVEEKPFVFNDFETVKSEVEIPIIESVSDVIPKEETEEIEVPTFNFDEIIKTVEETKVEEKTINKGPQIFSSVYVPEKEEVVKPVVDVKNELNNDDEMEFELPTLKKEEPAVEIKEEVRELPKAEEEIEMPVLNDYNLDELSGETYMINK